MQNFIKFRLILFLVIISLALGVGKCALAGDIMLNDLNGREVNFSTYQGKPAILFFWTTWCPYCQLELRKLIRQYPQMTKDGVILLGVNVSEPDYKVRRFLKGYALNFRILLDKNELLADKYDVIGVPTYVFLDKTGKAIAQYHSLPENYKSLLFK
jgi:peroxiredoxin